MRSSYELARKQMYNTVRLGTRNQLLMLASWECKKTLPDGREGHIDDSFPLLRSYGLIQLCQCDRKYGVKNAK